MPTFSLPLLPDNCMMSSLSPSDLSSKCHLIHDLSTTTFKTAISPRVVIMYLYSTYHLCILQLIYIIVSFFILSILCLLQLEYKFHEDKNMHLLSWLLYPQCLEKSLTQEDSLVNISESMLYRRMIEWKCFYLYIQSYPGLTGMCINTSYSAQYN